MSHGEASGCKVDPMHQRLLACSAHISRLAETITDLQDSKKLCMIPTAGLWAVFPALVISAQVARTSAELHTFSEMFNRLLWLILSHRRRFSGVEASIPVLQALLAGGFERAAQAYQGLLEEEALPNWSEWLDWPHSETSPSPSDTSRNDLSTGFASSETSSPSSDTEMAPHSASSEEQLRNDLFQEKDSTPADEIPEADFDLLFRYVQGEDAVHSAD
jgi:hypothetical protein